MHDGQQQIGDECNPYLYLDGIGTLAVEEVQREVLLDLLEQRLYLPALLVNGYNVLRCHHEAVVCCGGSELDVRSNPLQRTDDLVHLYSALLFSTFGVSSRALEYEVGEQRYGSGVDDLEFFHPFGRSSAPAVR